MRMGSRASTIGLRFPLFPSLVERGSQRRAAVKGARREGRGEASLDGEHRCEIIHARKEKASFLALAPTKKSEFPRKKAHAAQQFQSS
jgi:hypothetical protein